MGCCCTKSQKSVQELKSLSYAVHSAQPQDQAPVCPDVRLGQNPSGHDAQKGKEHKYPRADQASVIKTSGPDAISGQNPSGHDVQKGKENKHPHADQAQKSVLEFESLCDTVPSAQREDQEPMSQTSVQKRKSRSYKPSDQLQGQEPMRHQDVPLKQEPSGNDALNEQKDKRHHPDQKHQDVQLEQEPSGNAAHNGQKDKRHHPDQKQQNVGFGQEQSRNDVQHGQNDNHHPDQVRHKEEIKQLNDKIQELSRSLKDHQKRENNLIQKYDELSSRNIALEKETEELRIRRGELIKQLNDKIQELSRNLKDHQKREINLIQKNEKLNSRNIALEKEIEELRIRLSSLISAKLMDGNPEITDLSDPNRPTKIAEMYSELYDNAWTDAFDVLSKKESEETAIGILLDILLISYKASSNSVKEKWNNFNQKMESSKLDENTLERKRKEKNNLKKDFKLGQDSIRQPILDEIQKQVKLPAESDKDSMVMEYIDQVVKITWLMAVQDPMVYMENKIVRGKPWDKNKYKEYTKRGDTIDFVVWPPLILHEGGPLLMKGVAQGKQHDRTPAEDDKQIGGATHKEEAGASRNESCKSKVIKAKPSNKTAGDVDTAVYEPVKTEDQKKPDGVITHKDRDKKTAEEPNDSKEKYQDGLVQKNDQHGDMTAPRRRKSDVPQEKDKDKKNRVKSATEFRNREDNLEPKCNASGSVNQVQSKLTDNKKQKQTNRTVIVVGSASQMNTAKAFDRNTKV